MYSATLKEYRALLLGHRALLAVYTGFLSTSQLMSEKTGFWMDSAILKEYRALLIGHRAPLAVYTGLFW